MKRKKAVTVPMQGVHRRMASAMGIDAEAFHKGKMVLKRGTTGRRKTHG